MSILSSLTLHPRCSVGCIAAIDCCHVQESTLFGDQVLGYSSIAPLCAFCRRALIREFFRSLCDHAGILGVWCGMLPACMSVYSSELCLGLSFPQDLIEQVCQLGPLFRCL